MRIRTFFFNFLVIVFASFLFSGCLGSPNQGDPNVKLFNADGGKAREQQVAPELVSEANEKFSEPVKAASATSEDLLMIKKALAEDFKIDVKDIEITIERESSADFATGYVNVGEGDRGGVYFAAKSGEIWDVVYNGTGTLTCSLIGSYDFPVGMIPRCYDSNTGEMVDR